MTIAFEELKRSVHAALETYSNVHRGSGHHAMATTRLYEHARTVVLRHLGLEGSHEVVFCSPAASDAFLAQLEPADVQCLSSDDLGLPLGVRALAIRRPALKGLVSFPAGGGTARLVGPDWVVWAKAPGRFEVCRNIHPRNVRAARTRQSFRGRSWDRAVASRQSVEASRGMFPAGTGRSGGLPKGRALKPSPRVRGAHFEAADCRCSIRRRRDGLVTTWS